MKKKIITIILVLFFISGKGFSQDTTHLKQANKQVTYSHHNAISKKSNRPVPRNYPQKIVKKTPLYRDTRLGGSSKKYNTYKKNDNGAGAVTTNPK